MTTTSIGALCAALAAIPAARHARGMSRMWPRYRHGPAHIDERRPIAARWTMIATALLVVAAWLLVIA